MIRLWTTICLLLSIHPQCYAGELINVKDIASRKPVVSVTLNNTEMLQHNLQKNARNILALYLVTNQKVASTPVAGKYILQDKTLSFQPYYTLGYDTNFEVQFKENGNILDKMRFTTPAHQLTGQTAHVVMAYPTADTIPYNTLFFHIRFSHAMQQDEHAYKHIAIYDDEGMERERAWRQRSFWLDSGRLLVLMIHPGRVKNGIHYESPLFDSGKIYTLEVKRSIKDINDQPIFEPYTQHFYISGEDRTIPRPLFNKIVAPAAKTQTPLILTFSEGMDHASVLEGVTIQNKKGKQINCTVSRLENDNTYALTPHNEWQKGKYTLVINGAVYDYAANRINRPFEITDMDDIKKDQQEHKRSFTVR